VRPAADATGSDERRTEGSAAQPAPPAAAGRPVRRRQPTREVTRSVECPACGAPAGEHCRGRRGPRTSNHFARVELAVELRFGQRLELPRTSLPQGASRRGVKRAVLLDTSEQASATVHEVLDSDAR
jgi:hypothetical protein